MEKIEKVLRFLEKDISRNISFINFIKTNQITFLETINASVIGKGISDHEWVYLSCETETELRQLLNYAAENLYFAVIEDWMLPIITKNRVLDWKLTTRRYILPEHVSVPPIEQPMDFLRADDAEYLFNNSKYKDYLSIAYIKDRITRGKSSGIKVDGRLVAWAVTQDDGAMGFLTVLPEYREKGLAKKTLYDLIKKIRAEGEVPFAYIEDNNVSAIGLCTKIGFEKDRIIHWIKLAEE